jgi:hypothetical protein
MRSPANTSDYGHGAKYSPPGKITRHQHLVGSTSTSAVDSGNVPTTALGSGTGAYPKLFSQASAPRTDVWIGGIQMEYVPDATVDGIALIGDSTMAGSSGKKDFARDFSIPSNIEVSTVLGANLNVCVFNRAVGGETLAAMDARWAADMTPLAQRCKYAFIQGGINDIVAGRTYDQIMASFASMVAKAEADGLIARLMTITPNASCEANSAKETLRQQVNAGLISTYGTACANVEPLAVSPFATNALHPSNYGDGTHYDGNLKRIIGDYISTTLDWQFTMAGPYSCVNLPTTTSNTDISEPIDASGTITAGGTAQSLFSGAPSGIKLYFQNTSDTDMWINELGSTAVSASPSIKIAAGGIYESPNGIPIKKSISLLCATTGKTFTARIYYF